MTSYSEGPLGSILSDNRGVAWDDGAHDNVQTIRIYYHALGINTVQFEYRDGTKGDEHGNRRPDPKTETRQEFSLKKDEYLTMTYVESGLIGIKNILFQTNKRRMGCGVNPNDLLYSQEVADAFGSTDGKTKIVGFHGICGNQFLHKIGVHWAPV